MKSIIKNIGLILAMVVLLLFSGGSTVSAQTRNLDAAAMIADTLIARPLGLASIVIGSTMFVVALPFSAPANSVGIAATKMIVEPTQFTFTRPLGKI